MLVEGCEASKSAGDSLEKPQPGDAVAAGVGVDAATE